MPAEIKRLGLCRNVNFLGLLDADSIIKQLYSSSLVVVPSFIETYSLALAEAMYLGVPVVASYAGAMPELAKDGESALFLPIGDPVSCAMQIDRVLSGQNLAKKLSENARKIGLVRNNKESVLKKQLNIYNDILSKEYKK
ncbi:MAG: glycosyltransferase [Candidatus Bilamarchaeaceae archaeon]